MNKLIAMSMVGYQSRSDVKNGILSPKCKVIFSMNDLSYTAILDAVEDSVEHAYDNLVKTALVYFGELYNE